tara:strand:+ start:7593 stop:8225 length:633 start_codon:yes stop_codon:yes gene_type:complete
MSDINDILDGEDTGGIAYYDEAQDTPKVAMCEGSYPGHIVSVKSVVRTVKQVHSALIINVKVKIAEPCDDHSIFQALDFDGNKVEVNGGQFAGRELNASGIFKFLHPKKDDEFEPNPGGNKGYANFCTVVGCEPTVKEIEHNGEMISVKELPDLTDEDILGKPVMAVVGRGKPWKSDRDGKVRTSLEIKWFRNWTNGSVKSVEEDEDLPF